MVIKKRLRELYCYSSALEAEKARFNPKQNHFRPNYHKSHQNPINYYPNKPKINRDLLYLCYTQKKDRMYNILSSLGTSGETRTLTPCGTRS